MIWNLIRLALRNRSARARHNSLRVIKACLRNIDRELEGEENSDQDTPINDVQTFEALSTPSSKQKRLEKEDGLEGEDIRSRDEDYEGWELIERLLQRDLSSLEKERFRLSRELHDDIGQLLTALKINLKLIQSNLGDASGEIKEMMGETVDLADHILNQLRRLTLDLRSPYLQSEDFGLSLQRLCDNYYKYSGISVTYKGFKVGKISEGKALAFYRILQEALTNVVRHACATKVRVRLSRDSEHFYLVVSDNGIGFGTDGDQKIKGMGILGMKERLELFNGRLKIRSRPGKGSRIIALIPREEEDDSSRNCR